MNGRRFVLLGFAGAVVIIVYRDVKRGSGAPTPSEFLGAAFVYGLAGVISEFAPTLGGVFAVGWTIGLLFNLVPENAPLPTAKGAQNVVQSSPSKQPGYLVGGGSTRFQ